MVLVACDTALAASDWTRRKKELVMGKEELAADRDVVPVTQSKKGLVS